MATANNTILIFGCGYLGHRTAKLWQAAGHDVHAVTRSPARSDEFRRQGLKGTVADVTSPESLSHLPVAETVLFAVGFDRSTGGDIRTVYATGLENVLAALSPTVKRFIYISTTGVYGPASGEWVDESTPPDPQRDGGRASLAAEKILAAHPLGRRSVILRLAGIYGPGRVPYLDKLRAAEPLAVPSSGWLNLIHVDDAARIVVAADQWAASSQTRNDGPHVFCVSDGTPVARRDYYAEVARVIGAPTPAFCTPTENSPAAARAASDRRVSNEKMSRTLGVELQYPSYREGLAAILGTG